jgi:hypothetical protein
MNKLKTLILGLVILLVVVSLLFSDIDVVSSKERWKNFSQGVISLFFNVAEIVFHRRGGKMDIEWAGALARAPARGRQARARRHR